MKLRLPIAIAAAAALSLSLSGCFANPIEQLIESGVDNVVEQVTDGAVEIDTSGATLPANWPSEVPVPEGRIAMSSTIAGVMGITLEVASQQTAADGLAAIQAGGFETISELDLGGGSKAVSLKSASYTVQYTWGGDGDNIIVNMNVVPVE